MFFIELGTASYYSRLGVTPSAAVGDIRAAKDGLVDKLLDKQKLVSDEESKAIEEEISELNRISGVLSAPATREEYDRKNAHVKFFEIQRAAAGMFIEKADQFYVLDRVLRQFLAGRGVEIEPLSDLDREDFGNEETPIEMLDRLLK